MSSVLGVSVGAGTIHLARPQNGIVPGGVPQTFDLRSVTLQPGRPREELAAELIRSTLEASPDITATILTCRDEEHAQSLCRTLGRIGDFDIVPDLTATAEFAATATELQGVDMLAIYDLGAGGLTVTVLDMPNRRILITERTSDISGDYFDLLIREQQINSGRIPHPADAAGMARLDMLCRDAKEQLSGTTAVALPSEHGLVLLAQENFGSLIGRAIEFSTEFTRDVIARSGESVRGILAVGGGARIPAVAQALQQRLELPVLVPPAPETVAARGAALMIRPGRLAWTTKSPNSGTGDPGESDGNQLSIDDQPTMLLRPATEAAVSEASAETTAKEKSRDISASVLAVSALVVVAAIGLALGYGPQVLQRESSTIQNTPLPPTSRQPAIPPFPTTVPTTTGDHAQFVEPAAPQAPQEAPTTTPGPNTLVVPGLPPIVVPTLQLPFPPPPR